MSMLREGSGGARGPWPLIPTLLCIAGLGGFTFFAYYGYSGAAPGFSRYGTALGGTISILVCMGSGVYVGWMRRRRAP